MTIDWTRIGPYAVASIQKTLCQLDSSLRPADLEDRYLRTIAGWRRDENDTHSYWFQCRPSPTPGHVQFRLGWNGESLIDDGDNRWGAWLDLPQIHCAELRPQDLTKLATKPRGKSAFWTTRSNRYAEVDCLLPAHVQAIAAKW